MSVDGFPGFHSHGLVDANLFPDSQRIVVTILAITYVAPGSGRHAQLPTASAIVPPNRTRILESTLSGSSERRLPLLPMPHSSIFYIHQQRLISRYHLLIARRRVDPSP